MSDYRKPAGKGWLQDLRGRQYRELEGGGREHLERDARDAAVEETYRLSPQMRALCGDPSDVFAAVMSCAVSIAELYHQETAQWFALPGDARGFLERWCDQHFGRALEPAARMVLAYEIRRRLSLDEGGRIGPPAGPWKDWNEERKYEAAAASVPVGKDSFARVDAIARAAGVKIGPGVRPMPEAPDVESEANRQRRDFAL